MDMKKNTLDIVLGPIETYEDELFGYKAANEAFVLIKDTSWSARLQGLGWIGDDLSQFVLKEMDSLLLDEPRLAADRLAALLSARGGKKHAGDVG